MYGAMSCRKIVGSALILKRGGQRVMVTAQWYLRAVSLSLEELMTLTAVWRMCGRVRTEDCAGGRCVLLLHGLKDGNIALWFMRTAYLYWVVGAAATLMTCGPLQMGSIGSKSALLLLGKRECFTAA